MTAAGPLLAGENELVLVGLTLLAALVALLATLVSLAALGARKRRRAQTETRRILQSHQAIHGLSFDLLLGLTRLYVEPDGSDPGPRAGRKLAKPQPVQAAIDEFLKGSASGGALLLLGSSGMGKTATLVNYLIHNELRPAARRHRLVLVTLGEPDAVDVMRALDETERAKTVLMLDGLEQDPASVHEPRRRLREVIRMAAGFRRIIVTSTPELLGQLEDLAEMAVAGEPAANSSPPDAQRLNERLRLFALLPLTERQIDRYLKALFPIWRLDLRWAARALVRARRELVKQPIVLSALPDLLAAKRLPTGLADVYDLMIRAWLAREARWVRADVLLEFSLQLASHVLRQSAEGGGAQIPYGEAERRARSLGLDLGKWAGSERSLLVRNARDGFAFVHRSILDYLCVQAWSGMKSDERRAWVGSGSLPWTEQMKLFALAVFVRPGADLSYADLSGCDLSGTDLSSVRLEHACLRRVKLNGARLCDADLTGADLQGAELEGADLQGAVLRAADLREASLVGANLRAAIMGQAVLDAKVLGSVPPPGARVEQDVLIEPRTGMRFRWIQGDRYQMGGDGELNESPVHWVRLSSFWLGETAVTNRQYMLFLQETGHRKPAFWNDQRYTEPEQPVVGVSYDDATAFCRWLSEVSGLSASLPSEAQWEYAARGTDRREYPWGKQPPDARLAQYGEDAESGRPARVGSYPPGRGPFGTLDQAGNVWEWCKDSWDEMAYLKRSGKESIDPVTAGGVPDVQVVRGGSWFFPAEDLRAAFRGRNQADSRDDDLGFRVTVSTTDGGHDSSVR